MVARDYSRTLDSLVEGIREEYGAGDFHDYWELSREVLGGLPIRKFYVHRIQSGYGPYARLNSLNVTILTDGSVVDIGGSIRKTNESSFSSDTPNGLVVTPLKSIGTIKFQKGSIQTIRESSNAQLVLLAQVIGDVGIGAYWIANTDEEYDYLVEFGKALMKAVTVD